MNEYPGTPRAGFAPTSFASEKIAKNTPFHKTIIKAYINTIEYEKIEDKDEIVEKGREVHILSAPFLEVDGEYLKFVDAMKWASKQ